MLYEVAYYSDFIYINVYSSYQRYKNRCGTIWLFVTLNAIDKSTLQRKNWCGLACIWQSQLF